MPSKSFSLIKLLLNVRQFYPSKSAVPCFLIDFQTLFIKEFLLFLLTLELQRISALFNTQ